MSEAKYHPVIIKVGGAFHTYEDIMILISSFI